MLVLLPVADVHLIDFHRPAVWIGGAALLPGLPKPVQHEPGGALRHMDVAVELHAREALDAGAAQVDGDGPLAKRDPGVLERGSRPDAEVGTTVPTPVGHGLGVGNFAGRQAPAVAATALVSPDVPLEPLGRGVKSSM